MRQRQKKKKKKRKKRMVEKRMYGKKT